jgi:hypothetical protein
MTPSSEQGPLRHLAGAAIPLHGLRRHRIAAGGQVASNVGFAFRRQAMKLTPAKPRIIMARGSRTATTYSRAQARREWKATDLRHGILRGRSHKTQFTSGRTSCRLARANERELTWIKIARPLAQQGCANFEEVSMRALALTIVTVGTVLAVEQAPAQTYGYSSDPTGPNSYCLQGRIWGYPGNCQFSSYAQCMASASGTDAYCGINPQYAFAQQRRGAYRDRY